MKALFRNRWFWRVVGAIALGLLIFFVGPLVSIAGFRPLGWWPVYTFLALLPLILVGVFFLLGRKREQKRNAAMMEALKPDPGAEDRDEISAKLTQALDMLKSAKVGSRGAYAYQLPWYAIIGPSGAGKTTALLNCGLEFPTAVAGEYRALRGQPKTPNCDWWFTDEAVLIDTAGRYVTQDDDASADAAGWKSFLELLQQYRPLQPLNGVIVAIPAPDFVDPAKMAEHARHIRARLAEIGNELGQDLPVYVLITKADLLAGFREYFRSSTDSESDQVFGSTAKGDRPDSKSVLEGFEALVTSISARVVERMQAEPQMHLRAQIAAFPAQLASLQAPIGKLLEALGQKSRFDEPARVRGVYLSSSVQTGNPVDRILLSVGAPATHSAQTVGTGRSYFLKRFFSDLLIPEQGMAGRNPQAEKRASRNYTIAVAASLALLALCCGVWTWGYFRNLSLIDKVFATAEAYANVRAGGAGVDVDVAALGVLGDATSEMEEASDFGLGLGQGSRLASELGGIYGRDLKRRLAPMLVGLAEQRMAADGGNPTVLYDDLKSYLILGGQGPALGEHVVAWVQPAWIDRGGPDAETQAGELARHTQALFAGNFAPHAIDAGRVEGARSILRAQPAAVRVYGRLKSKALETGEEMWTARANAGPRPEVFFDTSGAFAPGAGVPALFTRSGYDKIFLPIVAKGASLLEEEKWVVGDSGTAQLSPAEMAGLKSDLERLYFAEFLDRWQSFMSSIKVKPAGSLGENVQRMRDGGGPLSPIKPLLTSIAKATDMTPGKGVPKPSGRLAQAIDMADAAGVGPGSVDGGRQAVVDAFLPLRLFVGKGEGSPLDAVLQSMTQLADKLNVIAVLPGGGGESGSQQSLEAKAAILQLDQNGNGMPAPAGIWIKQVASDASVALGGARLSQMEGAMSANFGESCAGVLAKSYPVAPGGGADLALADFARFFSPQGLFASFVNTELAGYLDKTPPSWSAKENAGEIGLTEGTVRAMQAADTVTRTFFANDPTSPRMSYQIEPVALSGADSVTLQVDGQSLRYDGKSPIPSTFDWPGPGGASITFTTEGGEPSQRTWNGPWAVFRMMKVAAIKSGASPAIGEGSLTQAGARFDFRIRTFAGSNPFVVDPFVKVRCPEIGSAAG